MRIVKLKTGLFPDAETVERAMHSLHGDHDVLSYDVSNVAMEDSATWARVAQALLAADLVVTI